MQKEEKKKLRIFSKQIQMKTIETIAGIGIGHVGGALSIADLLAVLYGKQMKIDPKHPAWEERDWLVVSKGPGGVFRACAERLFPDGSAEYAQPVRHAPAQPLRPEFNDGH